VYPLDDTIAAIASAPGGAARGIVRLSGPDAAGAVQPLFRTAAGEGILCASRPTAVEGELRLPDISSPLPCDVYLWPEGRSYTGQMVCELHTLGSPPLVQAVLEAISDQGVRLAGPGEFTLRAFLAARIDLTQAEAVLGVIDAQGPNELHVALAQLAGGLARPLTDLRDVLLELLAHLEAGFDFADEDLPFITAAELDAQLRGAEQRVEQIARHMASRGEAFETARVVLLGLPNAGKSSLFNALVRRAGALVSSEAGTTRDYLTATLVLDGIRCELVDTAGLDPRYSPAAALDEQVPAIHRAAQAATAEQTSRATLRLLCLDATEPLAPWHHEQSAAAEPRVVVWTKTDLATDELPAMPPRLGPAIPTSSATGCGLDALRVVLGRRLRELYGTSGEAVAATAARCHDSLRRAAESLRQGREVLQGGAEELVAAEIQVALVELGKVVGAVYTDDLLDRIFSRFCIGK